MANLTTGMVTFLFTYSVLVRQFRFLSANSAVSPRTPFRKPPGGRRLGRRRVPDRLGLEILSDEDADSPANAKQQRREAARNADRNPKRPHQQDGHP